MGKGSSTTVIQAPEAPDYALQMKNILQAQIDLAPQLYAAEEEYQKKYNALQVEQQKAMAQTNIETAARLYPQVAKIEAAYNAANRAAEVKQLETSLPQFQKAFYALTPGYSEAILKTGELAKSAMGLSANEMAAGKSLTPEEQRMADQSVRAAYAARGTALGPQAIGAEILNRADVANQRYQQRLSNAANWAQLGAGSLAALQQAQAPILQAYYKQPILQGESAQAQQMALAMQQQAGPQYFNPESQTGMGSIYGAYNAQMGLAGAQAQANAAANAGKSSMWGQVGGALIGAGGLLGAAKIYCWVAREVYGEDNPAWLLFRDWMLHDAPEWMRSAYIKYGERIAEFIKDKPVLKNLIRRWMDSKIA